MTTEQPNPQAVEETKRQIRVLVSEIQELARREVDPTVFYGEFLQKVLSALAAVGGAVWTERKGGGLELTYQINLRQMFPEDTDQQRHGRLLHRVYRDGEHLLVPPFSGAPNDDDAGNPTKYLLILAPIMSDDRPTAVVEIFQRPDSGPASQRGYLRFLTEMCQHAGEFLRVLRIRELADWQTTYSKFEKFAQGVHESLDPRTTAYTIANEGRRLIGCDRVSVAVRKGRKCVVEAVSGQDSMDTRANTVQLLSKLATAVMRSAEPLWYTGDSEELPPQIEDAVHNYVDETHTKTVAVLPLFRPSDYVPDGDDAKRMEEEKEEVIGCLIVEQIEDNRRPEEFAQGVDLVSAHSSRALSNAMTHNNLFLMPVWKTIGNASWVLRAKTLPKTIAVFVAVCCLLAFLCLWQVSFNMKADGKIQPKLSRMAFVEVPGKVLRVLVSHNQNVEKGQPLFEMRSFEMDRRMDEIDGKIEEAIKRVHLSGRRADSARDADEKKRAEQDQILAEIEARNLRKDRENLKKQETALVVTSPIAGTVMTYDPARKLTGQMLNYGDPALRIADLTGEWQLDLKMEENRMGHIKEAFKDEATPDGQLKVTYVLKTDSSRTLTGYLDPNHVDPQAQLHGEVGNAIRMLVEVDEQELVQEVDGEQRAPSPGAEVVAKVYCGKRSIGYVAFHQLIEFAQLRIFQWF